VATAVVALVVLLLPLPPAVADQQGNRTSSLAVVVPS
jgi:hypothetical protein